MNLHNTQDGTSEMGSVIVCISGDGRVIPPINIYKGSRHRL
jgi:hypothetical protein